MDDVLERNVVEELIILASSEPSTLEEVTRRIQSLNGRVSQIYGQRLLLAQLPTNNRVALEQALYPHSIFSPGEAASAPFALDTSEKLGLRGWSHRNTEVFTNSKAQRQGAGDTWGIEPPDPIEDTETLAGAGNLEAPPPDLSRYLIGSVAVGIIIVDGPTPDLQFSATERIKVVAEVQDGLAWLAAQEPAANITWVFDINTPSVSVPADPSLPMDYELREAPWRDEALGVLGYTASFDGMYDYVAAIRAKFQTDWAYVGFFTKYPIKHFAYAKKPRIVMHYQNNGWTPDNIAEVFTHETGHIFGCPDEYQESNCVCTSRHGYLREINSNCEGCANPFVPCLMASNDRALCDYTRTHLGWRDSNGDGVLDILTP